MKKKIISIIISLIMIMGCCGLSGCGADDYPNRVYLPEYESGYYKYAVQTKRDGTKKAYLVGLTDLGLEQTALVYPEEIDGIPVYGIGYGRMTLVGEDGIGHFYGGNVEKMFFPTMMKESVANSVTSTFQNTYIIYWDCGQVGETSYGITGVKGVIYGYNFYGHYVKAEPVLNNKCRIANVSYLYNYEGSPNEGYYWVDSYDESVITFIPPEPEREGYTFGGWYKEAECINAWDFSVDITGKEIILDTNKTYDTYEGIYLYAKWIKN